VIAWGSGPVQTNVPPGLNGVLAIAAGDFYCLASRSDGQVICWGNQTGVPLSLALPSAAIISPNDGTTETAVSKSAALNGNVVINGATNGPIVVDGNTGFAVFANGRVNYDTNYLNPPWSAYSMTNAYTANEIPDYTAQGTSNTLYDINRLIAVADHTPNGPSPLGNNHFTNLDSFVAAVQAFNNTGAKALEGVVVVDVWAQQNLDMRNIPNGINVRGSLIFNFQGGGWTLNGKKMVVTTAVNINPADLSGLVASDPSTYTSGFPAVYANSAKNPANINVAPYGYQNFTPIDDLPALVSTIGVVDLHGPLNVSGNVYTPSYAEIENKAPNGTDQTQYIKGSVITGNGFYFENTSVGGVSIISSRPRAAMASIAAGAGHNLALRGDGAVFSWGNLSSLPAGLSNVVAVAAGGSHNLALIGNGPPTLHASLANHQAGSGGFIVSAPTQSGRVYALEYKSSLADSGWTALPLVASNGDVVTFIDPAATDAQRFYRLRQW
jgi:hypothetical protein